jgi:RNA polymerase sigma factor for flagellar operon FliA
MWRWHRGCYPHPAMPTPTRRRLFAVAPDNRAIAEQHLELVRRIAGQLRRGRHVDFDDLVSWGIVGLLEAAERYDDRRGAGFATFAGHRVRGAMLDGLRRMSSTPRGRGAARRLVPDVRPQGRHGIDAPPADGAEDQLAAARTRRHVGAAVAALPDRERRLVEACYFGDRTLADAAGAGRITKSWASRLRARAFERLRDELAAYAPAA